MVQARSMLGVVLSNCEHDFGGCLLYVFGTDTRRYLLVAIALTRWLRLVHPPPQCLPALYWMWETMGGFRLSICAILL